MTGRLEFDSVAQTETALQLADLCLKILQSPLT